MERTSDLMERGSSCGRKSPNTPPVKSRAPPNRPARGLRPLRARPFPGVLPPPPCVPSCDSVSPVLMPVAAARLFLLGANLVVEGQDVVGDGPEDRLDV